jgi:formylglycine-generating enzyme required for sulfatase activity
MNNFYKLAIATISLLINFAFIPLAYAAGNPPTAVVAPTSTTQILRAFKDCEDCPEMAQIPAGSITLGTDTSHDSRVISNEEPAREVAIRRYALSKTEITNAQFAAFVKATHYQAGDTCWTYENGSFEERADRNWEYPGFPAEDDRPAACLNVSDVNAYAQWLSRKTGRQYRLPTEGEWQFAAEVGGSAVGPDKKHEQPCVYANIDDATGNPQVPDNTWVLHSCTDGYTYAAPVRSFKANSLGLYDMTGNSWEWTQDCHDSLSNSANAKDVPLTGAPAYSNVSWPNRQAKAAECSKNVLRGGSWYLDTQLTYNAYRIWYDPSVRNFSYGFRLASSLP